MSILTLFIKQRRYLLSCYGIFSKAISDKFHSKKTKTTTRKHTKTKQQQPTTKTQG
jgi:hypothetical protein